MNHNAIYFSLLINEKTDINKYADLVNHCLTSLENKKGKNFLVDVFFFIEAPPSFVKTFSERYSWVKFISFLPCASLTNDIHYHKWFNLLYFQNTHYLQVLYLDIDVYFSDCPSIIFSAYKESFLPVTCFYDNIEAQAQMLMRADRIQDILKYNGKVILPFAFLESPPYLNAGQMLFKKKHLVLIGQKFEDRFKRNILKYNKELDDIFARRVFPISNKINFDWASGEIIATRVFREFGLGWQSFQKHHIEIYGGRKKDNPAVITHFLASANSLENVLGIKE